MGKEKCSVLSGPPILTFIVAFGVDRGYCIMYNIRYTIKINHKRIKDGKLQNGPLAPRDKAAAC